MLYFITQNIVLKLTVSNFNVFRCFLAEVMRTILNCHRAKRKRVNGKDRLNLTTAKRFYPQLLLLITSQQQRKIQHQVNAILMSKYLKVLLDFTQERLTVIQIIIPKI